MISNVSVEDLYLLINDTSNLKLLRQFIRCDLVTAGAGVCLRYLNSSLLSSEFVQFSKNLRKEPSAVVEPGEGMRGRITFSFKNLAKIVIEKCNKMSWYTYRPPSSLNILNFTPSPFLVWPCH